MGTIRFGILGCGNIGTTHAKNLTEGKVKDGVLSCVCDKNPKKLDIFREKYGDSIKYFSSAEQMLASGECDCTIIAIPHYDHPKYAMLSLDAGLNCVVEKPAGVYTLQVKEMLEHAKKSDKILGIMFNQRTNPAFRKMKEMVSEGKIGEIKRTNWIITDWYRTQYYYDTGSWRGTWAGEGGGVLYNQAPHQLDLFQWIVGMMPSKVHAHCHFGKWHDVEIEDDVTCYCEYPNGATGVFISCTADAPGTNRFEITGTRGSLVFENDKLYFTELEIDEREHCVTSKDGFTRPPAKERVEVDTSGDNPQHAGILANMAATINGTDSLIAPAADGINGVMLANAMLLSEWLGKEVTLPFDDELFYEELKKRIATSRLKDTSGDDIVRMQ